VGVSGPKDATDALENQLAEQGVHCHYLHTSHAFHSSMVEPIMEPFAEYLAKMSLNPPQIPYISNVTGTWITTSEATDPNYWVRHLRQTVRFAEGIQTLLEEPDQILLEVGPGQTLTTLTKQYLDKMVEGRMYSSLRHPQGRSSEYESLLATLGKLWLAGVSVEWSQLHAHERCRRLPLPTYPFERRRYWVEPGKYTHQASRSQIDVDEKLVSYDEHPKLQSVGYSRPNLPNDYEAPGNTFESRIAAIWQELLGIEQVGIHDNFFDLGGHSLLATQLMARLHSIFEVQVPLRTLFEAPTIAELAIIILHSLAKEIDSELLAEVEQLSQEEIETIIAADRQID
jgi:phthiocerol/phenolphthiocerol synthesis type-I polyketide synthase E